MAGISSPTIIRTKNAVGSVVVPATRSFIFSGGLVVTQVGSGEAEVNAVSVASAWSVLGNAGAGLILGTSTKDEYNFVQEGISRAGFDKDGNAFLKTDQEEYGGRLTQSTNSINTVTNVPSPIFVLNVDSDCVGKLSLSVQGRCINAIGRCAFERTFLFWKEEGIINVSSKVQSDFTDKSSIEYDVRVSHSDQNIIVEVVGKNGQSINWTGHFKYQLVK